MTLPYAPLPTTFMRSKSFIETLFYNELETITICTFELVVIDIWQMIKYNINLL